MSAHAPDEPLRVGGEVTEPVELTRVPLDYARIPKAHIGIGIYEAVISSTGTVEKVRVLRSHSSDVDREVMRTLPLWRYKPATYRGANVPVYLTITLTLCGH